MKEKKFKEKQAKMQDEELVTLAEKEVRELCKTGGRSIKMCVPPMITDTDMILCELIQRYKKCKNIGQQADK